MEAVSDAIQQISEMNTMIATATVEQSQVIEDVNIPLPIPFQNLHK